MTSNHKIDIKSDLHESDTGSIIFRPAKENDLKHIKQIWINGLKQVTPNLVITDVHEDLFDSNFKKRKGIYNFWVAEKTEIIGWCSILPAFSHPLKKENNGEVSTYIDSNFTSNGVGTELMKFVFSQLETSEIEAVYGFANPLNTSSIKMCEKAGMTVCGQTSKRTILIKEYI